MLFYKKKEVRNVTISILWNHTWTNDAMINLKVNTVCCQKDLQSTHRTLSHSMAPVKSQWDEKASHCCSPSLEPPDTMEQLLEWGQTSPWAPLITLLGIASSLRMVFGVILSLRDLLWAYILPRIWPVDLVQTYGKWVDLIDHWQRKDVTCKEIQVNNF